MRSGKAEGEKMYIEVIFGGTYPTKIDQDYIFGPNDLVSAKAVRYGFGVEHQNKVYGYTD